MLDYTKKSMSGKSKSETWKYIVRCGSYVCLLVSISSMTECLLEFIEYFLAKKIYDVPLLLKLAYILVD